MSGSLGHYYTQYPVELSENWFPEHTGIHILNIASR
jgi:hypothetical protein